MIFLLLVNLVSVCYSSNGSKDRSVYKESIVLRNKQAMDLSNRTKTKF